MKKLDAKNTAKLVFLVFLVIFIGVNLITMVMDNIDFSFLKKKEKKTEEVTIVKEEKDYNLGDSGLVYIEKDTPDGKENVTVNVKPYKVLNKTDTESLLKEVLGELYEEPAKAMYHAGILVNFTGDTEGISIRLLNTEKEPLKMNGVKINDIVKIVRYKNDMLIYFELPNGYKDDFLIAFEDMAFYKISMKEVE